MKNLIIYMVSTVVLITLGSADQNCIAKNGNCQYTSEECQYGNYKQSLCSGPSDRQCCITADQNCIAKNGNCQYTSEECQYGNYEQSLCGGPSDRQCCVKGLCDDISEIACHILSLHNSNNITLPVQHPSGVEDNAYPLNNIQDACKKNKSSRSSYSCSECSSGAPGGSVCLNKQTLDYIVALADIHAVYITSIAGACHSCTSKHYKGLAVDIRRQGPYSQYVSKCKDMGGLGIDEGTHIHCQFKP